MGDSVLEHTGQISLTDTLLETEHPQNRSTTTVEQLPEMERPCPQECSSCLPTQLLRIEVRSFLPEG